MNKSKTILLATVLLTTSSLAAASVKSPTLDEAKCEKLYSALMSDQAFWSSVTTSKNNDGSVSVKITYDNGGDRGTLNGKCIKEADRIVVLNPAASSD